MSRHHRHVFLKFLSISALVFGAMIVAVFSFGHRSQLSFVQAQSSSYPVLILDESTSVPVTAQRTYFANSAFVPPKDKVIAKVHEAIFGSGAKSSKQMAADLMDFQKENPAKMSELFKAEYDRGRKTLKSDGSAFEDPLRYFLDESGHISEDTEARYYPAVPKNYGETLDFRLLIPTNFGLTTYLFSRSGEIAKQWGSYNTAFYSVAYCPERSLIAISAPGVFSIEIVDLKTLQTQKIYKGYSAQSLEFHNSKLYFGGYSAGENWDNASLFELDIDRDLISRTFFRRQLADVRGIAFFGSSIAASNGARDAIHIFDEKTKNQTIVKGFEYPNGLSVTPDGRLLVADEHHQVVRKINLTDFKSEWSSPPGQLRSPGYAEIIRSGRYKGHMLIADTDNQRVLVVDPERWLIKHEITNLRSVLKAIPLYDDQLN